MYIHLHLAHIPPTVKPPQSIMPTLGQRVLWKYIHYKRIVEGAILLRQQVKLRLRSDTVEVCFLEKLLASRSQQGDASYTLQPTIQETSSHDTLSKLWTEITFIGRSYK